MFIQLVGFWRLNTSMGAFLNLWAATVVQTHRPSAVSKNHEAIFIPIRDKQTIPTFPAAFGAANTSAFQSKLVLAPAYIEKQILISI